MGHSLHSESAIASADPFIFVDPAFPTANLYSIVVSPGVGNAIAGSTVPQPGGTWPMVAVGFAVIVFTRVRRRHRPSPEFHEQLQSSWRTIPAGRHLML